MLRARPLLGLLVVLPAIALLAATDRAAAQRPRGCGGQYYGQRYLVCHPPDGGSEAVPTICQRAYRNRNGQQVHTFTVCDHVKNGSTEAGILLWICSQYSRAPGDVEVALPTDVDAQIKLDPFDPVAAYPDIKEFDFDNDGIAGPVPAHRHPNGRGIVADSVTMPDPTSVFIDPDARVYGDAVIGKGAMVISRAQVYGKAVVNQGAFVAEDAQVLGGAVVEYYGGVLGRSRVGGGAYVGCGAMVTDDATIGGRTQVEGFLAEGTNAECGKRSMADNPGVVGGKASLLGCADVGAGMKVTSTSDVKDPCGL